MKTLLVASLNDLEDSHVPTVLFEEVTNNAGAASSKLKSSLLLLINFTCK